MRLFIPLAIAAIVGSANAQSDFRAKPLKDLKICTSQLGYSLVSDENKYLPADMNTALESAVVKTLTAYKILSDCPASAKNSYVFASVGITKPIDNVYRGYFVKLEVYTFGAVGFDGAVTLWFEYSFGVTSQSSSNLRNALLEAVRSQLDELAADYVTVNR